MKSPILKIIALIALLTAGGFTSMAQNNGSAFSSANNPVSSSTAFAIDKNIISVEISDLVDVHITEFAPYSGYGGIPEAWSPHEWRIRMIMAEGTDITSLAPIITLAPGATITSKHADVQDFSQMVEYTVICEDGSTVAYLFSAYVQDNSRAIGTVYVECSPWSAGTTTPGGHEYFYNETDRLSRTAIPSSGYKFKEWLVNHSSAGNNPYFNGYVSLNVSGWGDLTAVFEPIVQYTVNVHSEDLTKGTVSGGGTVDAGGSVWVHATPNSGNAFESYAFEGWYLNGWKLSNSASFNYTPSTNCILHAKFVVQYTVSVQSDDQNKGVVSGGGTVANGGFVWVDANPLSGYAFEGWYENETIVSGSASFPFYPISNSTLIAKFVVLYTVTVQSEDTNKGTVSGGGSVAHGGFVSIYASPKSGWKFEGWYLNGTKLSSLATYSFSPTSNSAIVAKFIPAISGPSTVCYNGSSFTLLNPPSGTIFWTVSNPNIFDVVSSGNPTTVTRKGLSTGDVTLSARTGSTSGPVVTTMTITPCAPPVISGPASISLNTAHTFTVSNAPSGFTWGHSSNLTPVSGTPGRFTGTTSGIGWVSIVLNGKEIVRHNVTVGSLFISGPDGICHGGYMFKANQNATWSVSYGFSLESTTGTSAKVISDGTQSYGTLTAEANGLIAYKYFHSCLFDGTQIPYNEDIYWYDVGCEDWLELDPPPPDGPYKWVVDYSNTYGVTYSFYPCCVYDRSVDIWFHGNGGQIKVTAMVDDGYGNYTVPHFTYYINSYCGRSSPDESDSRDSVEMRDIHYMCTMLERQRMCDYCNEIHDISESHEIQVTVFPNPVSGILTVEIEDLTATGRSSSITDIRLYDWQGNLQRRATTQDTAVQFNVSTLPVGIYYLHVYDGVSETPHVQQIVVER